MVLWESNPKHQAPRTASYHERSAPDHSRSEKADAEQPASGDQSPIFGFNSPTGERKEHAVDQLLHRLDAKTSSAIAPKRGSAAYYLARLQRNHPAIAQRAVAGELCVYKASVEAGLRKATAKSAKWTKGDDYMTSASVTA